MTKRSPLNVFLLSFVTCGLYLFFWYLGVKDELNRRGAQVPTAWMMIIPIINFIWMWKFAEGVERVTRGSLGAGSAFFLMLVGLIGVPIIQGRLNEIS